MKIEANTADPPRVMSIEKQLEAIRSVNKPSEKPDSISQEADSDGTILNTVIKMLSSSRWMFY